MRDVNVCVSARACLRAPTFCTCACVRAGSSLHCVLMVRETRAPLSLGAGHSQPIQASKAVEHPSGQRREAGVSQLTAASTQQVSSSRAPLTSIWRTHTHALPRQPVFEYAYVCVRALAFVCSREMCAGMLSSVREILREPERRGGRGDGRGWCVCVCV